MSKQVVSLSAGVNLVKQLGLKVEVLDSQTITIGEVEYRVLTRQTVPSPALVKSQTKARTAWVVPKLTKGLRLIAAEDSTSCFLGLEGGELWLDGKAVSSPEPLIARARTKGKVPWSRFALMRALAQTARPRTQTELAVGLGITQPAVSHSLATLSRFVEKTSAGWVAKDFDLLASEFMASYPGPGGVTVGWFSLDPLIEQSNAVLESHPEVLLSADAAADQIAPWRLPKTAVVYSPHGLDLRDLGFTEAPLERATLKVVVPADPYILKSALGTKANLVDGLQVAFDLSQALGSDALDATEELLQHLRTKWEG